VLSSRLCRSSTVLSSHLCRSSICWDYCVWWPRLFLLDCCSVASLVSAPCCTLPHRQRIILECVFEGDHGAPLLYSDFRTPCVFSCASFTRFQL
jgi:hypothetical protein